MSEQLLHPDNGMLLSTANLRTQEGPSLQIPEGSSQWKAVPVRVQPEAEGRRPRCGSEVSGCRGGMNRQSTEGWETDLCDTVPVITRIHLSKPIEDTPGANPKVNCGLWVMMMCPCGFLGCNT